MRFAEYRAFMLNEKRALGLTLPEHFSLRETVNPASPPWRLDWCLFFEAGMYIRVVEFFRPKPSPDVFQGYREHFSFQYGVQTGFDPVRKAPWPWSTGVGNTVIRVDLDRRNGPHLLYKGQNHIPQTDLNGTLVLAEMTVRQFIDSVMRHRHENGAFESILDFDLKGRAR